MGAETQNQRLAGSAAARMRSAQASREGVAQRQKAIEMAEKAPQTGEASMFPGEAPQGGNAPLPPGLEEAYFRRSELTRERDRTGRREEIFRDLQRGAGESASVTPGGAVERGATAFGAPFGGAGQGPNAGAGLRSGIAFGPGRSTRMPEVGSPEYQQLLQRVRGLQNR
jgi:hypothetical protein